MNEMFLSEDQALVERTRAGDFDAFDALVTRYEWRMYSVALGILRHPHDAEDATQTAFLQALEKINAFRGEAAFSTWLTRITVNAALKVIRSRKGKPEVPLEVPSDDEDGLIPHPDYVAQWKDDPARLAEDACLRRKLDEAIEDLPENHRVVFVLRDVQEMSTAETAAILEISEANVKVRLLRARLALRETLTRMFGDPALVQDTHERDAEATPAIDLLRSYQTR